MGSLSGILLRPVLVWNPSLLHCRNRTPSSSGCTNKVNDLGVSFFNCVHPKSVHTQSSLLSDSLSQSEDGEEPPQERLPFIAVENLMAGLLYRAGVGLQCDCCIECHWNEYLEEQGVLPGGIVALGKFEALHIGHRELAIQAAKIGVPFLLSFVGMAEVLGWELREGEQRSGPPSCTQYGCRLEPAEPQQQTPLGNLLEERRKQLSRRGAATSFSTAPNGRRDANRLSQRRQLELEERDNPSGKTKQVAGKTKAVR
nr:FAD synthetase 2, chloroplastic-like [Ipomoea batatas]